jgi:hypothetical protein
MENECVWAWQNLRTLSISFSGDGWALSFFISRDCRCSHSTCCIFLSNLKLCTNVQSPVTTLLKQNVSSFLHHSICRIHASCCFLWYDLRTALLVPTFNALAWVPYCHGQSSELIQSWHHVSWVFIETVMLIVFPFLASTYSAMSCVFCWPSRTFFIQPTVQAFFKCLANLFTLCHLKQPSPFCPSTLLFASSGVYLYHKITSITACT